MIYIFTLLFLLILICRYDINGIKTNRIFWYRCILLLLIAIAGLRYRLGADTPNYLYKYYHYTPYITGLKLSDLSYDSEPLYKIVVSFFRSLGLRFYVFQIFHSSFINILLFIYIRRHCRYIFTCVLFYFIWMYVFYNMEEMRASLSVVVCLYANDYFLKKKWLKGYSLILIGCMFHKSTYALLLMPFFYGFLHFNGIGLAFLMASFFFSLYIKTEMAEYVELFAFSESFSESARIYANNDFYGMNEGNLTFHLVHVFPYIVYPFFSYYIIKRNKNNSRAMANIEPFIIVGMMFVLVRANIEFFYRYVHFYAIYIIITLAELLIYIIKSRRVSIISYIMAFVVFSPLFVMIGRTYVELYPRYYPYASVIDKTLDFRRERLYSSEGCNRPNINEY